MDFGQEVRRTMRVTSIREEGTLKFLNIKVYVVSADEL